MALTLESKSVEVEKPVGWARLQIPVRAETAPSGLRESGEVLLEDARLALAPGEVQKGRARVSGRLYCQALYRLEGDTALRTLSADAAFEQGVEVEGAEPGMTISLLGEVEHLEAAYAQGRMTFTATVSVRVRVTSVESCELLAGAADERLETLEGTIRSRRLLAESTASVSLRDEAPLPAALKARGALLTRASVINLRCERESGGVRVGGEVNVESLVKCGVEGRPLAMVKYALPFEQPLAFPDWLEGACEARAHVAQISATLSEDETETALEIACEVAVEAGVSAETETAAVLDAYGCGDTDVAVETREVALCEGVDTIRAQESFRGELLLPDGAQGVGTVLAVRAAPYVAERSGQEISGILETAALYVPAGREQVASARAELPFTLRLEREIPEDADLTLEATDADATSVMSDRMEVRCTLSCRAQIRRDARVTVAASLTEQPAEKPKPGIVLCFPGATDDIWKVAKRYRAPRALIESMNTGARAAGEPMLIWL